MPNFMTSALMTEYEDAFRYALWARGKKPVDRSFHEPYQSDGRLKGFLYVDQYSPDYYGDGRFVDEEEGYLKPEVI